MPSGSCTGPFGKRRTSRTSSRPEPRRPASTRPENKRALDAPRSIAVWSSGPLPGAGAGIPEAPNAWHAAAAARPAPPYS